MKEEGLTAKHRSDIINELRKCDPELAGKLESLDREEADKALVLSDRIKKAIAPTASIADKEAARTAAAALKECSKRITALYDEALLSAGLSDADIQALDAAHEEACTSSLETDISLKNYTPSTIASTGQIETILPDALERLLCLAPTAWLDSERKNSYRLDASYMSGPLSIVNGARVESVLSPVHRFAQALLVSQDFLSEREDYDFHAGALLVPQTGQLGASLDILTTQVHGNVVERIEGLFRNPSSGVDSTIYELLVGAACQNYGRQVEMLPSGQEKTPDMRIVDGVMPMPTVVECKRRQFLLEYEKGEEQQVRTMFQASSGVLRNQGTFGILEVEFLVEVRSVAVQEFVSTVARQARYGIERTEATYPWGKVKFVELPKRAEFTATRLYSPSYLNTVFHWNGDVPEFDGLVCQSVGNGSLTVSKALEPVALKWRSRSPEAQSKKLRAIQALLSDGMLQVPPGEIGILYICYQEGAAEDIADGKSKRLQSEMRKWYHRSSIMIPAFFVNRLYPRVLGDGNPDLIENVLTMKAVGVHPSIFDLFPACVFTRPS